MKHNALYSHITKLRLKAAEIYDVGKASKISDSELVKAISPLTNEMHASIKKAEPYEMVVAIKSYEHVISGLMAHLKEISQKIEEEKYHLEMLKVALKDQMHKDGVISFDTNGYLVTLTKQENEEILSIR